MARFFIPKKNAKPWKLLDVVTAAMFAALCVFLVLVFTPLGDSLAASGKQAMDFTGNQRQKVLKLAQEGVPLTFCPMEMADFMPCQDPKRSALFSKEKNHYRERHCPPENEKPTCIIPTPLSYKIPIPWPDSLHKVWFSNMPYGKIAERKGHQGWMRKEGEYFIFPGGGTMFPEGATHYIEKLEQYIPLGTGEIRTVLDAGCGVASFGAYLLGKDILTMSFAPRDSHKAQIQFALERGIPAFVAMLGTQRLPFPARSYDLVHCSRCLIHFSAYNGSYLIEVDRLLRPGGYFVLSGPPVGWKNLETEWTELQELAQTMCYKMITAENNIAIWQKPYNHTCYDNEDRSPPLCEESDDPNAAWYVPLKNCISRVPKLEEEDERAGGTLPNWPERLLKTPRRFSNLQPPGGFLFDADTRRWNRRVRHYKEVILVKLGSPRMRNVLDMNAVYGGFAASIISDPVWVMNVVPAYGLNTLPVIYDRGLIGVAHDWCEAFSTYPRTYDLIHVANMKSFTTELKRCHLVDVLLEMDRILRPKGTVIIRDTPKMLERVSKIANALRWSMELLTTELGLEGKDRLLVATKPYSQKETYL